MNGNQSDHPDRKPVSHTLCTSRDLGQLLIPTHRPPRSKKKLSDVH